MTQLMQIGRYKIEGKLDQGGMATVYRGVDPRFKRTVALKIVEVGDAADSKTRQRFEREARLIAKLEHPAILQLYDYGEENGRMFLVMPLMSGGSLRGRLAEGRVTPQLMNSVLQRIGGALDYIHEQGIVHRDLKPANILFDENDLPYLSDFGIVKRLESNATLTGTAVIGTPEYMSPEQVTGSGALDGSSDQYALGIILYEMLTGRQPYKADTATRTALMHVRQPIPNIRSLRPELPAGYETIMRRVLAKQPSLRYSTVAAFLADLANVERLPPPAPETAVITPPPSQTLVEPRRNRRWLWAALALLIILLGGGALLLQGGFDLATTPTPSRVAAAVAVTVADTDIEIFPTESPIPSATIEEATAVVVLPTSTLAPTSVPANTPTPAVAVAAITVDNVADLQKAAVLASETDALQQVAISPDEQWLAAASDRGVQLYSLPDLGLEREISREQSGAIAWSPDGRFLAVSGREQGIVIFDTSTWEGSALTTQAAVSLDWSPTEPELLLAGTVNNSITLWDVAAGSDVQTWRLGETAVLLRQVRWSPQGDRFGVAAGGPFAYRFELAGDEPEELPVSFLADDGVQSVAWSPDGGQFAAVADDGRVRIWFANSLEEVDTVATQPATALLWFAPGELAIGMSDGNIETYSISSGRTTVQVTGAHADIRQLHWLAESGQMLSVGVRDQTVRLWNEGAWAEESRLLAYALAHEREVSQLAWSPTGDRLAVGHSNGVIYIFAWQAGVGEMTAVLPGHDNSITALAWSPDGDELASAASRDTAMRYWNLVNGETAVWPAELDVGHSGGVTALGWRPAGNEVVSGSTDNTLRQWSVSTGENVSRGINSCVRAVAAMAFNANERLAVAGENGMRLFTLGEAENCNLDRLSGHDGVSAGVVWGEDGRLISIGATDGRIKVWELADGAWGIVQEIVTGVPNARGLNLLAGSNLLVTTHTSGAIIWDLARGEQVRVLDDQRAILGNAVWHPSGRYLATVDANGQVNVWHVIASP